MIIICITIILCVLIITLGFVYYIKKYYSNVYKIDDKVYKDRLSLLKDKYNQVKTDYDDEDESIPLSVHQLISLIKTITDRVY